MRIVLQKYRVRDAHYLYPVQYFKRPQYNFEILLCISPVIVKAIQNYLILCETVT